MKKKYNVLYWVHMSDIYEIEAESEEEAENILREKIENGELGNIENMDIGDDGIECQGVIE